MKKRNLNYPVGDPMTPLLKKYASGATLTAQENGRIGAWAAKQKGQTTIDHSLLKKLLGSGNLRMVRAVVEFEIVDSPSKNGR